MASTPSLVKRNTFSKAVAESMVQLHQLSKEALSQKARGEPQWSKYGQKIIDLVELWENALSEEKQQQYEAEEATRTPNKRKGGSHDEDFAARFAARKKGGGIEKFPSARKEKEKAKRKWAHVNHEGGYGRCVCVVEITSGSGLMC